jgi:hypothetical protein
MLILKVEESKVYAALIMLDFSFRHVKVPDCFSKIFLSIYKQNGIKVVIFFIYVCLQRTRPFPKLFPLM